MRSATTKLRRVCCQIANHCVGILREPVSGVHSRPGQGVIYVFAMVGRGPYKVEVAEQPTSDALLIADRIVSAVGPYKLPPTIAPIKIPDIVVPSSDVDSVGIRSMAIPSDRQPHWPTSNNWPYQLIVRIAIRLSPGRSLDV